MFDSMKSNKSNNSQSFSGVQQPKANDSNDFAKKVETSQKGDPLNFSQFGSVKSESDSKSVREEVKPDDFDMFAKKT